MLIRIGNVLRIFAGIAACWGAASAEAYKADDTSKTITSDGSVGDTQNAVNYVAAKNADGWVLTVGSPGANYSWAPGLNISIPHQFTIQGASPSARPTITCSVGGKFGIFLNTSAEKTIVFKDFIFNEWGSSNSGGLIMIQGSGVDCFRLTNLKFNHNYGTGAALWVSDLNPHSGEGPYGLIDHCEVNGNGYCFVIRENQQAETGFAPGSWMHPMTWGTKKAVYVEDCNFYTTATSVGGGAVDGDDGARWVLRHCTLTNFSCTAHGADSAGPVNSSLQHELMHNTFTINNMAVDALFFLRGGTAVVFDNTVNGTGAWLNFLLKPYYYRADGGGGSVYTATVDRIYPRDYVGTQQPGSGVVTGSGQDPKFPEKPWGTVPIYCWGNHLIVPASHGEVGGDSSNFIQPNRDYFLGTSRPGYTEFTYPHPLTNAGSTAASLAAPTNLQVGP